MKKINLTIFALLVGSAMFAQVGIGTNAPSAELEIGTTTTGIPALELNPQTAPIGNTTGQFAVIGDKLYMYDSGRSKWLSVETSVFNFGGSDLDNENLLGVGSTSSAVSGYRMPLDGTIVHFTIRTSGGINAATQGFRIQINGTDVGDSFDPTQDGNVNISSQSFSYSNYNIDLAAGDYLSLFADDVSGTSANIGSDNVYATFWVKWRQ